MNIPHTKKFGLIGYPLGHSMSAVIHKELFKISGVDAEYSMLEIPPESLNEKFNETLKGLNGFNATIPHKINIIPLLDELSERASLFGSVNTVDIHNGRAKGYNTDCTGFLRALEMADIELGGRTLLCGSGGVARMIAFEAVLAGADLTIAVRESDLEAGRTIKKEIQEKVGKDAKVILLDDVKPEYDLIVNGTPVGMFPNVDACPLKEEIIKSAKAVFDVIYNPIETKFIKYAKEAGIKYSGGLSMLVWQAAVAEEIWNGVKFTKQDIEAVVKLTEKELGK